MMPEHIGDKLALSTTVGANDILPKQRDYYRFNGSLTIPPCTEDVRWFVMKREVPASKQQIVAFKNVLHEPNNRPLQPENARTVLKLKRHLRKRFFVFKQFIQNHRAFGE